MTIMMIPTAVMVLALVSSTAIPCEATSTTHRRTVGTELYRVQPTQKVIMSSPTSSMKINHNTAVDFERFDDDAKRALGELMMYPAAGRHWEGYSSMEYLSLSFAPIISMSMSPPPMTTTSSPTSAPTADGTAGVSDNDNSNVAPINRIGGAVNNDGTASTGFNQPATISATVFLLIAAMAVTALVVRKYKQHVVMMRMMAIADDQDSFISGSVITIENIPVSV